MLHHELGLMIREAEAMSNFKSMVTKRSQTPTETKNMLLEFNPRAKKVEEITGSSVDSRHALSVMVGILDAERVKQLWKQRGPVSESPMLVKFVAVVGSDDNG